MDVIDECILHCAPGLATRYDLKLDTEPDLTPATIAQECSPICGLVANNSNVQTLVTSAALMGLFYCSRSSRCLRDLESRLFSSFYLSLSSVQHFGALVKTCYYKLGGLNWI